MSRYRTNSKVDENTFLQNLVDFNTEEWGLINTSNIIAESMARERLEMEYGMIRMMRGDLYKNYKI